MSVKLSGCTSRNTVTTPNKWSIAVASMLVTGQIHHPTPSPTSQLDLGSCSGNSIDEAEDGLLKVLVEGL